MKGQPTRAIAQAVAASTALLLGMASGAWAQEEPIVIGAQARRLPTYFLQRPFGSLNLNSQYNSDQSNGGATGESESSELRFEETITLQTTGYVVHPNFLNLDLAGEFGLTQQRFSSQGQEDDNSNSTLYLWNAQAVFLREQPTSLTLYTQRTTNIVDRAFAQSFRSTYTTYGSLINTRYRDLNTSLRVYRTEQEQTTLGGASDFSLIDNVLEWRTETAPAPNQSLSWDYRIDQSTQGGGNSVNDDSTSQSASVSHSIAFGPANRYSLGSALTYSDSTGDFGLERIRLDEQLRMQHSSSFETEYEYIYDQQNSDTSDRTLQRGTAEFRHRLYKSLFTHGELGYQRIDFGDGGGSSDWSADVDSDYVKKVPHGELHSTLNLGYNVRSTEEASQAIVVDNQPYSFVGFQPIVIPGQTLDPNSIVLADSFGRIYAPGLDYTVTQRPDGVQIDRVIGGAIPSDSTVLADYVLGPVPGTDMQTGVFGITLRYDVLDGRLRGFSPYVRYAMIEQSVSGGGGQIRPDSVRNYLVGADYRTGRWLLTAEHEFYDSALVPYQATRLIARYDYRASASTLVTGSANYTYIDYSNLDQQSTTATAALTVTHRLTRELLTTASASCAYLDNSAGGQTMAVQESLEVRWVRRQLEIFARARNSNRFRDEGDSTFQYFELGIRREF